MHGRQCLFFNDMGDVLAIMYVAAILFFCGLILLIIANDSIRKFGVALFFIGLILFIACLIYLPHAHETYNFYQPSSTTNY